MANEKIITFNDDGGWCWFQDKRTLMTEHHLIIGSFDSGNKDKNRQGNIELTSYDLKAHKIDRFILHHENEIHKKIDWCDDHCAPALLVCEDNHILTAYSKHHKDNKIYFRRSKKPLSGSSFYDEEVIAPSLNSLVTYNNLFLINENGRNSIYNFFRGLDDSFMPSLIASEDDGLTWTISRQLINSDQNARHRPYIKFSTHNINTIHFAYTNGHPRDYDNNIYHGFYRDGKLWTSSGNEINSLLSGLSKVDDGTIVFKGNSDNVAWISDIQVSENGFPSIVFSVQKDGAGMPRGQGGFDHRYYYAYFDGSKWVCNEIAFAGHRLYSGEDDYTGLISIDPSDLKTVYLSANVDPKSGELLINKKQENRYEIFKGTTVNYTEWLWEPVTQNSFLDNIRPMVCCSEKRDKAVLWLRGKMKTFKDYEFEIVGFIQDSI